MVRAATARTRHSHGALGAMQKANNFVGIIISAIVNCEDGNANDGNDFFFFQMYPACVCVGVVVVVVLKLKLHYTCN